MSDITDNLDFGFDIDLYSNDFESLWDEGVHIDRSGKKYNIFKMKDSHLLNVINYFDLNLDTSVLKREARRRGILPI